MKFYDILQLDPQITKRMIDQESSKKEKQKLWSGMIVRSILIVLFAIVFISSLTAIFGKENTPMAVVIFCVLLGARFVDFGYRIKDSIMSLALVFALLLFAPILVYKVDPLAGLIINIIAFWLILFLTCDKPEMGNGGLFNFAYIYLSGNPVFGEMLIQRLYLTIVGFVICAGIFYIKHKDKHKEITLMDKIKLLDLKLFKYQWMLRMTIGISMILSLGLALKIERFMWAGFACGSLLCDYSQQSKIKEKFSQRLIGVAFGSIIFCLLYSLFPDNLKSMIGPLGGFCLGLCVDYKYKTAMNCLGALMIASNLYGMPFSIALRLIDTLIGVSFALIFYLIYEKVVMSNLPNAK